MAYFQRNEDDAYNTQELSQDGFYDDLDEEYQEEETEELTEEEEQEKRTDRLKVIFGAGNLVAIIGGVVLILVLLAMLMSMFNFLKEDIERNFSLLTTRI